MHGAADILSGMQLAGRSDLASVPLASAVSWVQVGVSKDLDGNRHNGTYEAVIADAAPLHDGTSQVNWERGTLTRGLVDVDWTPKTVDRSNNDTDPALAADVAAGVMDAFRGFQALGIKPNWNGLTILNWQDIVTIELNVGRWQFDRFHAPPEALEVLCAASRVFPAMR